jgi:hypothetical protein
MAQGFHVIKSWAGVPGDRPYYYIRSFTSDDAKWLSRRFRTRSAAQRQATVLNRRLKRNPQQSIPARWTNARIRRIGRRVQIALPQGGRR